MLYEVGLLEVNNYEQGFAGNRCNELLGADSL